MSPGESSLGQGGVAAREDMMYCAALFGVTDGTIVCGFVTPQFSHMRCHAAIDGRIQHKFDDVGAGAVDQIIPREVEGHGLLIPRGPSALVAERG